MTKLHHKAEDICAVLGPGLLLTYVLLSVLSRAPFSDYDLAFATMVPLTVTGDAGCLAAVLAISALHRADLRGPALAGYGVAVASAGLGLAALVKAGLVGGGGVGTLLVGDLLSGFFCLIGLYLWWKVLGTRDEGDLLAHIAMALLCAVPLFLICAAAPVGIAHICMGVILPAASCLCFIPFIAAMPSSRDAQAPSGSDTTDDGAHRPSRFPPALVLIIFLSFFVVDLQLDLFPICLFYDAMVVNSLNMAAVCCVALLLLFGIALLLLARRGNVPLPFLYSAGFLLTAAGYLVMPYRPLNGAPLGAGEAGRFIVCLFALVVFVRFARVSGQDAGGAGKVDRLFLRYLGIVLATMLVSDVIVVVLQLQPGFDYADFVSRTLFSGVSVAILVILLLGPLQRLEKVLVPPQADDTPASAVEMTGGAVSSIDAAVEALSRSRGLTPRESEIVLLIANGRDVPYIERELVLAKSTVKTHIKHIYEKCDVSSRQNLIDLLEEFRDSGRR